MLLRLVAGQGRDDPSAHDSSEDARPRGGAARPPRRLGATAGGRERESRARESGTGQDRSGACPASVTYGAGLSRQRSPPTATARPRPSSARSRRERPWHGRARTSRHHLACRLPLCVSAGCVPLVLLAVAAATVAWQAPEAFVDGTRDIEQRQKVSQEDRSLAPAHWLRLRDEVLIAATDAIPEDAPYTFMIGDGVPLTETERVGLEPVLRYYLLPRALDNPRRRRLGDRVRSTPASSSPSRANRSPGVVIGRMSR